jgi:hypothetical protein
VILAIRCPAPALVLADALARPMDVPRTLHLMTDAHRGASRQGPSGPRDHQAHLLASPRFPVRGLLPLVSLFEHQHRADEAGDMRGRRTHLEGFVRAFEAGHQFPSLLGLVIEYVFHGRRPGIAMGLRSITL